CVLEKGQRSRSRPSAGGVGSSPTTSPKPRWQISLHRSPCFWSGPTAGSCGSGAGTCPGPRLKRSFGGRFETFLHKPHEVKQEVKPTKTSPLIPEVPGA